MTPSPSSRRPGALDDLDHSSNDELLDVSDVKPDIKPELAALLDWCETKEAAEGDTDEDEDPAPCVVPLFASGASSAGNNQGHSSRRSFTREEVTRGLLNIRECYVKIKRMLKNELKFYSIVAEDAAVTMDLEGGSCSEASGHILPSFPPAGDKDHIPIILPTAAKSAEATESAGGQHQLASILGSDEAENKATAKPAVVLQNVLDESSALRREQHQDGRGSAEGKMRTIMANTRDSCLDQGRRADSLLESRILKKRMSSCSNEAVQQVQQAKQPRLTEESATKMISHVCQKPTQPHLATAAAAAAAAAAPEQQRSSRQPSLQTAVWNSAGLRRRIDQQRVQWNQYPKSAPAAGVPDVDHQASRQQAWRHPTSATSIPLQRRALAAISSSVPTLPIVHPRTADSDANEDVSEGRARNQGNKRPTVSLEELKAWLDKYRE